MDAVADVHGQGREVGPRQQAVQEGDPATEGAGRVGRVERHVVPLRGATVEEPVFRDVDAPQEVATAQLLNGADARQLSAAAALTVAREQSETGRHAPARGRPRGAGHRLHVSRHQRVVRRRDVTSQCRLLANG